MWAIESLNFIERHVNTQLAKVSEWLLANKLSLNVSKSNFLIISPKSNKPINRSINNEKLKEENYTKYLGIIIDEKLSWKQHIKQVNIKLSKGIGVLYRLRHSVPKNTLRTVYNSSSSSGLNPNVIGVAGADLPPPLSSVPCLTFTDSSLFHVYERYTIDVSNLRKTIRVVDFPAFTAPVADPDRVPCCPELSLILQNKVIVHYIQVKVS